MPNWCNNFLELRHPDPEQITRAEDALQRGAFLQEFLPCPQELLDPRTGQYGGEDAEANDALRETLAAKYGYCGWYDWQIANWGTKWDVGGTDACVDRPDANTVTASFDSAWAPPVQAYQQLEQLGFEITALYHEPGMAFCGQYADGQDDCREYSGHSGESVRQIVGQELDDFWNISADMDPDLDPSLDNC